MPQTHGAPNDRPELTDAFVRSPEKLPEHAAYQNRTVCTVHIGVYLEPRGATVVCDHPAGICEDQNLAKSGLQGRNRMPKLSISN